MAWYDVQMAQRNRGIQEAEGARATTNAASAQGTPGPEPRPWQGLLPVTGQSTVATAESAVATTEGAVTGQSTEPSTVATAGDTEVSPTATTKARPSPTEAGALWGASPTESRSWDGPL